MSRAVLSIGSNLGGGPTRTPCNWFTLPFSSPVNFVVATLHSRMPPSSCELSTRIAAVAPVAGIELQSVGHLEDERHDIAAVTAGVRVVGLHDVAEKQCCAPVGMAQLERVVDPNLPLACEDHQQSDQRQNEGQSHRMVDGDEGDQEADWRECDVDDECR